MINYGHLYICTFQELASATLPCEVSLLLMYFIHLEVIFFSSVRGPASCPQWMDFCLPHSDTTSHFHDPRYSESAHSHDLLVCCAFSPPVQTTGLWSPPAWTLLTFNLKRNNLQEIHKKKTCFCHCICVGLNMSLIVWDSVHIYIQ